MRTAYSLDSFRVRGAGWRVRGWCANVAPLATAELRVETGEGFPLTIKAPRGHGPAYPVRAIGGGCTGFFGFGAGWPSGPQKVTLHLRYEDGSSDTADVTRFLNRQPLLAGLRQNLATAWRHMRRGRYRLLATTTLRALKRRLPKTPPHLVPGAAGTPLSLIIDHDLGGGANKFALQLADDLRKAGKSPARLIYSLADLRFELHLPGEIIADDTLEPALAKVAARGVSEIHVNSLVTYPANGLVLRQVRELAGVASAPVHVYMHDYYAACPSYNLINWRERYCGVPATGTCNTQCLPRVSNAIVRSQAVSDVAAWRREWEQLLLAADVVRFFSQVSFDIVSRAIPNLPVASCVVAPHRIENIAPTPLRPRGVTIAVVGDLHMPKGAGRVRELCDLIARSNANAKIVVIGTIDEDLDHSFVRMTGPYDSARLGAILAKAGAAVAFFPSIWPETFSYVVSELMQQHLPIVAFDIGAPAERLSTYGPAALLPVEASSEVVLAALMRLALASGATGPARSRRR
jgi:glycosyltransferase involved in cell wall biosynthesis